MESPELQSPPGPAPGGPVPKKSGLSEFFGTILILCGVLIFLAAVSYESVSPVDGGAASIAGAQSNMIGTVGHYTAQLLFFLFGKSAFLLGPYLFLLGFLTFYRGGFSDPLSRIVAVLVVMAGTSLLGALIYQVGGQPSEIAGGLIGARVGQLFQILFGSYGGFILALAIFLSGVFLAIRVPVPVFFARLHRSVMQSLQEASRALTPDEPAAATSSPPGTANPIPVAAPPVEPAPISEPEMEPHAGSDSHTDSIMEQDPMAIPEQPEFVRREAEVSGEQRPWIQRVQLEPEDEAAEVVPSEMEAPAEVSADPYTQAPEDPDEYAAEGWDVPPTEAEPAAGFEALHGRTRLSRNARHLRDALAGIEAGHLRSTQNGDWLRAGRTRRDPLSRPTRDAGRRSPDSERPAAAGRVQAGQGNWTGYFNEDESRFHFRSSTRPVDSGQAPAAFRGESVTDSTAAMPRAGSAASADRGPLLESMDLELLAPRRPEPEDARFQTHTAPVSVQPTDGLEIAREIESEVAVHAEESPVGLRELESEPAGETLEGPEAADIAEDLNVVRPAELAIADADLEVEADLAPPVDNASEAPPTLDAVPAPLRQAGYDTDGTGPESLNKPPRRPRKKPVPESAVPEFRARDGRRRYHVPGNLLKPALQPPQADVSRELELTRERLEKVMQDYGIQARVVRTQRGPIITLYEVKLEAGVRVSRILGISDEIKMNLEAPSIRIIAPIPGKPTVGIEIPNRHREGVVLGDMLDRDVMSKSELAIVLGKDIAGERQYVDLARLPHLLIAGSTGSGKSVYMNAIIASLLYTRSPEDVRFIMIDPKMVELKLFEGIPHLIMPVITDVRLASKALNWVIGEMERRYEILSHLKCRDIRSYNDRVAAETRLPGFEAPAGEQREKMPYIVVFIDELSDLMMVAAKDVEDSIIRLTQKARAVGIHVVMATQRPSVDVITALIKANCPARIAFHVAQKTDSRTILDMNGAESLLGKGDMLYRSPSSTGLVRMQAPLLTEAEIESVVQETARYGEPAYVNIDDYAAEDAGEGGGSGDVDAELLEQAWQIILESGKTSTSYIQRRLRIGYNRAASLIELLEMKGYLSEAMGNKPREILKRS